MCETACAAPLALVALLLLALPLPFAAAAAGGPTTRPATCAGRWYPSDPAELTQLVDKLLAEAAPPALPDRPLAIIVPHAGYRFSAPAAAAAYATLHRNADVAATTTAPAPARPPRVVLIAFSHRYASTYHGVDVPRTLSAYATPLGPVPVDQAACAQLAASSAFTSQPAAADQEHSLELQLPFLQRALGSFTLVPLLVGTLSDRELNAAARALLPLLDERTIFVVSSDFTHFGPDFDYVPFRDDVPARLRTLADQAAAPIATVDYDGFVEHLSRTGDTICGHEPIRLLLRTLAMGGGAQGVRTACDFSGTLTGDWTNSVTYQSFAFTRRPGPLTPAEQLELLRLARQTISAYLRRQPLPEPDDATLTERLRGPGACFVTLTNRGDLRGCIGTLVAREPICEAVIHNAVSACQDPRFTTQPVTAAELDRIHVEISYLTPLRPVSDPAEIIIGRHGLLVSAGGQRGVLLPQVAYEEGWTRAEFLAQTCRKAGLPLDAWKRRGTELNTFEAQVFGEPGGQ